MSAGSSAVRLKKELASLAETTERLSRLSRRSYQNPYSAVEWPATARPEDEWFSSPEYLSLYGTPEWEKLDDPGRKRLAFYEAVNFYSLNIHGEKGLMEGLAARLYRKDLLEISEYLHHFLDEENKHSIYFGGFCTRYAKVYRSRQLPVAEKPPREVDDLLFFVKTMVFEEIVDDYNWVQSRDPRLERIARFINHNHHFEESRHLIFGRQLVTALWRAYSPGWSAETQEDVRAYLEQFFIMTWREYYNPDVYVDAGFQDAWELAESAWSLPAQREHRRAVSAKCVEFLRGIGLLLKEPSDAF
ncbi:MAG: hypothetical protein JWQ95_3821 [Sphaerisporangium sp.]|nr:hypothetical protein [Sphaerisporangium sp.]